MSTKVKVQATAAALIVRHNMKQFANVPLSVWTAEDTHGTQEGGKETWLYLTNNSINLRMSVMKINDAGILQVRAYCDTELLMWNTEVKFRRDRVLMLAVAFKALRIENLKERAGDEGNRSWQCSWIPEEGEGYIGTLVFPKLYQLCNRWYKIQL